MKIDDLSKDYSAMAPYWRKVDTIVEGIDAMRSAREKYLPRFPNESKKDYEFRLSVSTMTNVYRDVVESLANKPFAEETNVVDNDQSPEQIKQIAENIDGRGNHIHVFLADTFFYGINNVIDWILVDYPVVDRSVVRTLADERAMNVRPYWVHIRAEQVLEIRSEMINGIEQIVYVRIRESEKRIRVFEQIGSVTTWAVYLKDEQGEWNIDSEGVLTIGIIPMVPFFTGRRKGASWQFNPALKDAADLQIELFQKETALKHVRTLACFPMLAGNGIQPDTDASGKPKPIPVGPGAVLYAPPNDNGTSGAWTVLSADSASMQFLAADIATTQESIRELGKQPLTAQSGNVTRITAAFAASKGNSSVQKWALDLKDAAEQCLMITAKWLGLDVEPELRIFTDFPVEMEQDTTPGTLLQMRSNGDLSRETLWTEMKRRGIFSSEFDIDSEKLKMAEEIPADDGF